MQNQPPFKLVEEPPKRGRGVTFMVIAGFLGFLALVGLLAGVNAVLYFQGAGSAVEVTVTESSGDDEDGAGHYERDGEIVQVRLAYATEGETVRARLPVIWMPVVGNPVYSGDTAAYEDLQLLIGVLMIGFLAVVLFKRGRGHYTGAIRVTRRYFLQGPPPGQGPPSP